MIALISAPGAERHHQAEPARLGQLREAGDEQRADDQRRLAERRPQPCFEHETGVSRREHGVEVRYPARACRPGARAAPMPPRRRS